VPILVPLAFPFFGKCFHRNRVDQRVVAVNQLGSEKLKSTSPNWFSKQRQSQRHPVFQHCAKHRSADRSFPERRFP
jgi:hypothetical protein